MDEQNNQGAGHVETVEPEVMAAVTKVNSRRVKTEY